MTDTNIAALVERLQSQSRHHRERGRFTTAETYAEAATALTQLEAERARLEGDCARLRAGLQFYADGNGAVLNDPSAWDTVSGEPQNFLCDEADTATIEDGSVARLILEGWALPTDPDAEAMIPPPARATRTDKEPT